MNDERDAQIIRRVRAGERVNAIAREFGLSRQRVSQILNGEAHRARTLSRRKLRGSKPDRCERCGDGHSVQAHHTDYSAPLVVEWLCGRCHTRADRERREQEARVALGWGAEDRVLLYSEAVKAGAPAGRLIEAIDSGVIPAHFVGGRHAIFVRWSDVVSWAKTLTRGRGRKPALLLQSEEQQAA